MRSLCVHTSLVCGRDEDYVEHGSHLILFLLLFVLFSEGLAVVLFVGVTCRLCCHHPALSL